MPLSGNDNQAHDKIHIGINEVELKYIIPIRKWLRNLVDLTDYSAISRYENWKISD